MENNEKIIKDRAIEALFSEMRHDYSDFLSGLKVIVNSAENDYTGLEKEDFANAVNIIVRKMEKTNRILDKCFDLTMEKCELKENILNT